MADLDTLQTLAEKLRNDGYWTGALEEASAGILALLDENERLRATMADARLFVGAVAGENQPDRAWAISLRDRIDANLSAHP